MNFLSPREQLAIAAVIAVATRAQRKARFLSAREFSTVNGISTRFMELAFQALVHNKILVSQHGQRGGYALARSPDKITLYEIVSVTHATDIQAINRVSRSALLKNKVAPFLDGLSMMFLDGLHRVTIQDMLDDYR